MLKLARILAEVVSSECSRPLRGPHAGYIPNIVVRTHLNQRAWFYDDLILGRIVLIHCMSSSDAESLSNLENLARVQPLIEDRQGRSVFIYSITTDPLHDTPQVLHNLAQQYGARDGWMFLTGEPTSLTQLRQKLFTYNGGHDCSMTLLRYANEAAGVWGGTPVKSSPEAIAERIRWITPQLRPSGRPQRGGPPLLAEQES
jgi:protein SCO1/2